MNTLTSYARLVPVLLVLALAGCGGGGGGGGSNSAPSSRARFVFECDLNGVAAALTIEVEAVGTSGIIWGSGPNPDIKNVVATGSVIYYTAGTVVSPNARYVFRGENDFADFTNLDTNARFRVRWIVANGEFAMMVNPFGPGPAQHNCKFVSAQRL